jgi:sugar phosphate isomerase/epimerase
MVFGYSTNAFVNYNLFEAVEKIAALGFAGVEVMADRPHLYPPDFDDARVDELAALLERLGLAVTNLNSFTLFAVGDTYLPSWIEPESKRRQIRIDHTLKCLHLAKRLGCANISVPPGGPLPKGMTRSEAMDLFLEGLEKVIPTAEVLEVRILVEPEPDLLIERSSEFTPFIAHIDSPMVGLNFDIGHFFCAGEDPAVAFETLFEWVGHVHLEDIAASREHNHLITGHGAIDFAAVFKTMRRLGYQGDISLELYPYTEMPEEAGRQSLAHIGPIFESAGLAVEGVHGI